MRQAGRYNIWGECTAEEMATIPLVVGISQDWQEGALTIEECRDLCTGFERFTAMRCTDPESIQRRQVKRLVESLANQMDLREGRSDAQQGSISRRELADLNGKTVTNWQGERVHVFPLHYIDGIPIYPPYDVPPGDLRRSIEARLNAEYSSYRKANKKTRKHQHDE